MHRIMVLILLVAGPWVTGWAVELAPAAPEYYRVVEGDTVWDVASRFLAHPWEWPAVWRRNPALADPDLIYPGDVLELTERYGEPRIRIATVSEVRLQPRIRVATPKRAIPTILIETIRPFLSSPRPLTEDEKDAGPFIVALPDRRIAGGAQDWIYVRALPPDPGRDFTVFRVGQPLTDGETGETLGYEGIFVADAVFVAPGDPATLELLRNEREAVIGDRVLSRNAGESGLYVHPHAMAHALRGHIIGVLDGVSQIGQYQVVTLDRGTRDGIESGHVFEIVQKGIELRDPYGGFGTRVFSPEQAAGELLVFRVFERISYALILRASRPVHVLDLIQTPR
ncbi:MAG: LysM peptidoglycan-binding domain-containing protein [Gammaproteobacteria bacterium]|nr:LysM peptidoglycan-binding domain-containing protein [Gammaproteobacteria bacterium]